MRSSWQRILRSGRALGFTPTSLFSAGESGAWYDVGDLTTIWQDDARTIPGAVGQPVGCIDDKSGNGLHMKQATAGSRGTLKQNALGKYYVEFTSGKAIASAATFTMRVPFFGSSAQAGNGMFRAARATNQIAGFTGISSSRTLFGTSDATEGNDSTSSALGSISDVALTPISMFGTVTNLLTSCSVGGGTEWTAASSVTDAFTMSTLTFSVNTTNGTAAHTTTCHFYGGLYVNRAMTASDKAGVISWLNDRCGVSDLEKLAYDIFAIGGQSNASGQGDAATSVAVPLGQGAEYQDGFIKPLADPTRHYSTGSAGNVSGTGSAWPAFAKKYYDLTGRRALIVGGGMSGIGLTTGGGWNPLWNTYGTSLVNKVIAAKSLVQSRGGTATLKGLIYFGGETDATSAVSQSTFEAGLATLLTNWQTAVNDTASPIFFVSVDQTTDAGQDAAFAAIRQALVNYAAAEADAHLVVPYQGFETAGQLEDTTHLNQTALNTVGDLAATNIAAILYP